MTTYALSPQCARCLNLRNGPGIVNKRWACVAFPDGIPKKILTGDFDHTEPYHGDHGVQFESIQIDTVELEAGSRYNCSRQDMIHKSIKEMPKEYSPEEQRVWIASSLMAWHEAQGWLRKDKDIFADAVQIVGSGWNPEEREDK